MNKQEQTLSDPASALPPRRALLRQLSCGLYGLAASSLLSGVTSSNAFASPDSATHSLVGRPAPAFKLPRFTLSQGRGLELALNSLEGQWVYLDFWASWCAPCVLSFPFMNNLQAEKSRLGIQVVAISVDRKEDRLDAFLATNPAEFTVLWDASGKAAKDYAVATMPTSFLINPKGVIVYEHKGFTVNTAGNLLQALERYVLQKS